MKKYIFILLGFIIIIFMIYPLKKDKDEFIITNFTEQKETKHLTEKIFSKEESEKQVDNFLKEIHVIDESEVLHPEHSMSSFISSINYIIEAGYPVPSHPTELTRLVQEDMGLALFVLNDFANISPDSEDYNFSMGVFIAAQNSIELQEAIIDKVRGKEDRQRWSAVLATIGVNSGGVADIVNMIEKEGDINIVADLVMSLGRGVEKEYSKEEMEIVEKISSTYIYDGDPYLKFVSTNTLLSSGSKNTDHIDIGINSNNPIDNSIAISAIIYNDLPSDKYINQLFKVLEDTDRDLQFRVDAFTALTMSNLNESQQEKLDISGKEMGIVGSVE